MFTQGLVVLLAVAAYASKNPIDWSKVKPIDVLRPLPVKGINRSPAPGNARITGGEEATPHSLPYQVALLLELSEGTAFCGGSLLSPDWVLTAAHCVDGASSAEVILGAHNVREEESTQVRLTSTEITIHPEWNSLLLQNDLALIKLPQSVQLNENIQTIRLPSRSQLDETFVNSEVLASGWGKPSDSATSISPVLRYVYSTVISKLSCNIRYLGVIQDSHICSSGSGGKSTCSGDSGGPLVIKEADGKSTQVGIVSFGISFGCEIGWPAVFSRVTSFAEWISAQTGVALRN
ncbi:brachyurin [Anabrus simplex]|uniref:brachyurin n=1 Tax=Anabrus simplex TaxID=316456 RepID=UPI0035A3B1F6